MSAQTAKFLHLARPVAPATHSTSINNSPISVNIHPQAILSILDHAVHRNSQPTQSSRVIGALVGTRSEDGSEVEVRSCFPIPHTETEDQVEVDVDYQKNMLALTLKASPREVLLGWYTTSHELNSFSGLIQNFFASPETGTFPHPAIHLTVSTEPGAGVEARCYIGAPLAVNSERAAEACLFIQVPHKLLYGDAAERSALEAISSAKNVESRTASVVSEIESIAQSLEQTIDLLSRVSDWVNAVLDEDEAPNHAVGQFLMNALSLTPNVSPVQIDRDFNSHIQDVLMVAYLANTIRTQIDLSQRLATSTLGAGDKDGDAAARNADSSGTTASGDGRQGMQRNNQRSGNNKRNQNNSNSNTHSSSNNRGPRTGGNQSYQKRDQKTDSKEQHAQQPQQAE